MFESAPNNKIAVSYVLRKANGDLRHLVLVFSVQTTKFQNILICDNEVTQMCTSGNSDVLIVATTLGSLMLYDLKNV